MAPKTTILSAIVLMLVAGLWLTRTPPTPEGDGHSEETLPRDPARFPEAVHISTHGISFGTSDQDDIFVVREGEKIRIEIRKPLLDKLPPTLLPSLGWTGPSNLLSEDGYNEFLEALDSLYHHGGEHEEHHPEHREPPHPGEAG